MPDDPARRAHAVFSRAMELDGDRRDAMVREECEGDPDLLRRVERLLRAAGRSEDFLESPAVPARGGPAPSVPDAVGNYLVVGVLGVGGMATVYEAVQENPHRRVALKVMHRSVGHTDAMPRFRLEAQTLARLHHPGIAQIYEAGAAMLGQTEPTPFFAMELVPDAMSITQYAEHHALPLRERLEMFASVCDAVLHGHQNGIIHRDIKPANVLVGSDGLAKVIDFGIARATGIDGSAITGAVDARQIIGTLNSMSPEQCVDPAGIDVRSDVYSLGVVLYELVTGCLPHDLSHCSIPQAVRIITDEHPRRAGARRREAAGDLEAIIAMAMEKDRARRYSGAGALAADVRRFLNHQPIEARRASVLDHARKFARRNPPLVAAIGAAILVLLVGTAVSVRFAYTASIARDDALRRERELAVITEFQESMLRGLDVAAMGNRLRSAITASLERGGPAVGRDAGEAVAEWNRLADTLNFTTIAVGSLHESVIRGYADSINSRFASQPLLRARLLQQLASTMNTLGLHREALPLIAEAASIRRTHQGEDHEDTLQSRRSLGSLLATLGRYDESLAHLLDVYERSRRRSGPDSRDSLATGTSLGGLYRRLGDLAGAERVWTDTLERQRRVLGEDDPETLRTLNNIGVLFADQGRYTEAEAAWRELLDRRRAALGPDHPDYVGSLANLGQLFHDQGRYTEAEPLIRQSLDAERRHLGDRHRATLTSMSMLASLLSSMNRLDEALPLQSECYEGRLAVLGPEHPDTLLARSLLGTIMHACGDRDAGERHVRLAAETQIRVMGEEHPMSVMCLAALRDIELNSGRLQEALPHSERIVRLARGEAIREPFLIGAHLSTHGDLLSRIGRPQDAWADLHDGYDMIQQSVGASHPFALAAAARLADYYATVDSSGQDDDVRAEHEKWRRLAAPPPP
ncbi:MAG: serine/threonine protein kinase [Phycisphaeraceae bacterium]|nr:MAG: serine/threonine protein kinase [Phycisphaeraceae bacterium]